MRSTDVVSAEGVACSAAERAELSARGMLPRGTALVTGSGALAERGIACVVHAATGAMTASGGCFEPTLDSVGGAVRNALLLARARGLERLAIPFVGGAIFLRRIGCPPAELAEAIVRAALAAHGDVEVVLVAWSAADAAVFRAALERVAGADTSGARVVQGDLTDPAVHGAPAIVNAANLEVRFGGGLSGAIAAASGQAAAIDAEAAAAIAAFWAAQPEADAERSA
jgi:O-acetyl-ADP-ribose deacetylase (regulator of RNase III)